MQYKDENTGFLQREEALRSHCFSRIVQFPPPSSVPRNMRHADSLSTVPMTRFATSGKSSKTDRVTDSGSHNPGRTVVFQACRFSAEPESSVDGGS